MPSTNTITAFYTFNATTPARSSEVNNNFSIFRGSILPVNTDTQTASDLTHNMGSLTHRWLGSWHKEWSGETAGSLYVVHGGETSTAFANISNGVIQLANTTCPAGGIIILDLSSTMATISRSSAGAGSTTSYTPDSTAVVQTIGRPVFLNFSGVFVYNYNTSTAINNSGINVYIYRDDTQAANRVGTFSLSYDGFQTTAGARDFITPFNGTFFDPSPGQTERSYFINFNNGSDTTHVLSINSPKFTVYETK